MTSPDDCRSMFSSTTLPRLPFPCTWSCPSRVINCQDRFSETLFSFFWLSWNSRIVSLLSVMSLSACFRAALIMVGCSLLETRNCNCERTSFVSSRWKGICASSSSWQPLCFVGRSGFASNSFLFEPMASEVISRFVTRSTYTLQEVYMCTVKLGCSLTCFKLAPQGPAVVVVETLVQNVGFHRTFEPGIN